MVINTRSDASQRLAALKVWKHGRLSCRLLYVRGRSNVTGLEEGLRCQPGSKSHEALSAVLALSAACSGSLLYAYPHDETTGELQIGTLTTSYRTILRI
jgi:hypothetical protein